MRALPHILVGFGSDPVVQVSALAAISGTLLKSFEASGVGDARPVPPGQMAFLVRAKPTNGIAGHCVLMHWADIISDAVEMSKEIVPDEAMTGLCISTVPRTHSRGMLPLVVSN